MKRYSKIFLSCICAAVVAMPVFFAACGEPKGPETPEAIDYAAEVSLDLESTETKKQEVTVRMYVDGDTTHFNPVTNSTLTDYNAADFSKTYGYIKARYLAVNTPESTGDIEKWGKTASIFTRETLEKAETIVVESDDDKWNIDSTGERYTLWIWYRLPGAETFRNLNIELLQNGYGRASSSGDNRYGKTAVAAIAQATALKLRVFSPADTKDPNFHDDPAAQLDLKTLRFHVEDYKDMAVRVEGVVTARFRNSAYIEDYDPETETTYGISVFYGYALGSILDVLTVGNRVSVHGKVSYYEAGDTYQISDVENNEFRPESEENTYVVEEQCDYEAFKPMDAKNIVEAGQTKTAQFEVKDENGEESLVEETIDLREALMSTSVTLTDLHVDEVWTTKQGESAGAISLTCRASDGTTITVRTEVLKGDDGKVITEDAYLNKTISVKGIIDKWDGGFQVRVHRADFITINS